MALPILASSSTHVVTLRSSLKPPPAPRIPSFLLYCSLFLFFSFLHFSLAHTHTHVSTCAYIPCVRARRAISSTSTIRRVRRSTPPRFNIQTICNNFAATITSSPTVATVLPSSRFCSAYTHSYSPSPRLSRSSSFPISFFRKHRRFSAVSIVYFPSLPSTSPRSPRAFLFLFSSFFSAVLLPPYENAALCAFRTHPHRDSLSRDCFTVLHRIFIFHPAIYRNHSKSPREH